MRTGSCGAEARRRAASATMLAAMLAAACAAHAPAPAVLVDPTAESRSELARVVSQALGGAPVTLAADALAGDGTLIIERTERRDASGHPLSGRDSGRPDHFHLVKDGTRCLLVYEEAGKRYPLESASCAPR